jgi:hypothetical protein
MDTGDRSNGDPRDRNRFFRARYIAANLIRAWFVRWSTRCTPKGAPERARQARPDPVLVALTMSTGRGLVITSKEIKGK